MSVTFTLNSIVVTADVPHATVAAGVPARVVRKIDVQSIESAP
jgi:acetyltransferase-like isoleucine patch superfamily enzyme